MTLFEGLKVFLTGFPSVTAFNPISAPLNPISPWATIRIISGVGAINLDKTRQKKPIRIEISIWSNTALQAEQLVIQLESLFIGFNGYLGGGTNVHFDMTSTSGPRSVFDPEARTPGMQLDILGLLDTETIS